MKKYKVITSYTKIDEYIIELEENEINDEDIILDRIDEGEYICSDSDNFKVQVIEIKNNEVLNGF